MDTGDVEPDGETHADALPRELFRFEGGGNLILLRLDTIEAHQGHPSQGRGSIEIACGDYTASRGVVGSIATFVGAEDLDAWQRVLDSLDAGYDASWREDQRATEVHVQWEGDDRLIVSVRDRMGLLTTVETATEATEEWFDEAYRRLDDVYKLFEEATARSA